MILLVDIGNTRMKWRYVVDDGLCVASGILLNSAITDEYFVKEFSCINIEEMFISNVGHDFVANWFKKYAKTKNIKIHFVQAQKCMNGLSFSYERVERLGVDRCLAMIGAYDGVGVLVIDAGSAITADFISDSGEHYGGYILPGYDMSRCALLGKTAKIGVVASLGDKEPGQNTESCVNNGFTLLYQSLIEGCLNMAKGLGIFRFVVTGGDAEMLKVLGSEKLEHHENLVLDGLQKYSLNFEWVSEVNL